MSYKLPYPKHLDVTEIKIEVLNGYNSNGTPKIVYEYVGKCRFNETHKQMRDADGKLLMLEGKAYIGCDVAPNLKRVTGTATINGVKYQIYKAGRPRNPDGTVNHTKLELM